MVVQLIVFKARRSLSEHAKLLETDPTAEMADTTQTIIIDGGDVEEICPLVVVGKKQSCALCIEDDWYVAHQPATALLDVLRRAGHMQNRLADVED